VRLEIGGVAPVFQDQPGIAVVVELMNLIGAPAWRAASWSGQFQQLCAELAPGVPVSTSSEVVPEIREYERTSTTCGNVYVMPLMARYLDDLERKLHDLGIPGHFYIMLSSGGVATPATAKRVPIGRMGEAEEFGDLVAFLVSERAAFITGTAINFDGGMAAVV